ncbi:MAG: DUF4914 family protein, partial [Desulfobacterales bacterium]|nr:DUF4914 family protein [Desulfobacterales bacterium]
FGGQQIVVHDRSHLHEIFSFNLYPGPSAKKGVYGALIERGEQEGWVTTHCSTVQVKTPYDNIVTVMHEGASGGGKSEMLQQPHRLSDGRLILGKNTLTGETRYVEIPRTCELHPVCDDMGMCHPDLQNTSGKLTMVDAEDAWFIRVDHIKGYGTDPELESLTIAPTGHQLFLNVDASPKSTALIWDHVMDAPDTPCPNPRVIVPRNSMPDTVDDAVDIDIRSFGVRTPPCHADSPSYGILGLMHILPPALAWLWRLVAPRGHANPSIVGTEGMSSEGVGSYWPFSTGRKVSQANLLLRQIQDTLDTCFILVPNQHIGVWETSFMPQWLARDYMARRGSAKFDESQISPSRCPLLGYSLDRMRIEGVTIPKWFLKVETQPEVGLEAYDEGSAMLTQFFKDQLRGYLQSDIDPLGRSIISCSLDDGSVADYESFLR